MTMMLSQLLPDQAIETDVAVENLTDDSREVRSGTLFLAVKGLSVDGRGFINDAVKRGAVAVLAEPPVPTVERSIPVIEIPDLSASRGRIASRFFEEPSTDMLVVAVTGTNGKTSCSHFIARALEASGRRCGIIGTLGFGFPGNISSPGLTTPGAIEMQRRLATLKGEGADAVALEASSHGLAQDRLAGTSIDVAVLTNITRDHLDYHETFTGYRAAKRRLFEWRGLGAAVLNFDDDCFGEFAAAVPEGTGVFSYSTGNRDADVHCDSITWRPDGFDAEVVTPWGNGLVSSPLLGEFNVSNLLAAVAVLGLLEHDIEDITAWASRIDGVAGRMDLIHRDNAASVVIDYAHTPDALEKALTALRRHTRGRIWCLVGCGGDRDKGKRPMMGSIASRLADVVVLTNDNPRFEDPAAIINDVRAGADGAAELHTITDRAEAIAFALDRADTEDLVLIAGKGHEDYQDIGGHRVPYSDYVEVDKHSR